MNDRALFRLGGLALIVAAVAGAILNAVHPRDLDFDNLAESLLETVAETSSWSPIHIGLVIAAALGIVGFMGLYRSISGDTGSALARLALVSSIVGGSVLIVTLALDGVAVKHAADIWSGEGADQGVALVMAEILTAVTASLLSVSLILFFGLGFGLFGLAIALGDGYPRWLGWLAVIGALASIWGGAVYFYDAQLTESTLNLLVVSSLFLTVVGFVIGVFLYRKGAVGASTEV